MDIDFTINTDSIYHRMNSNVIDTTMHGCTAAMVVKLYMVAAWSPIFFGFPLYKIMTIAGSIKRA